MRVSVIQTASGSDKASNLDQVAALIEAAVAADRPEMLILPEMWNSLGGSREAKFANAETLCGTDPGLTYSTLSALARRYHITLHGGSIAELSPQHPDRLYNTTVVFGPDGMEIARYRKIHLFDITSPNGHTYRESETYAAGEDLVTFGAGSQIVGCAICYDLRFAPLFAGLRDLGATLLALPAAFTAETGAAHWQTLIRARAIETQCWVAAAGTIGAHVNEAGQTRLTYGHSMIVDPWGSVVAQVSRGPGWTTARIDPELTRRVRADMPVMEHRRLGR